MTSYQVWTYTYYVGVDVRAKFDDSRSNCSRDIFEPVILWWKTTTAAADEGYDIGQKRLWRFAYKSRGWYRSRWRRTNQIGIFELGVDDVANFAMWMLIKQKQLTANLATNLLETDYQQKTNYVPPLNCLHLQMLIWATSGRPKDCYWWSNLRNKRLVLTRYLHQSPTVTLEF